MKNILKTNLILIATFIISIVFSGNVVQAVELRAQSATQIDTRLLPINLKIDEKSRLEIEATLKKENALCETLSSAERRTACLKETETRAQLKLQQLIKTQVGTNGESRPFVPGSDKAVPPKNNDVRNDMVYPPGTRAEDKKDANPLRPLGNNMGRHMYLRMLFTGHVDLVLKSQDAIYERFTSIADRIDSRIEKLKAESIDVSASEKFVAEARAELKLAKNAIESAKSAYKTELAALETQNKTEDSTNEEKADETTLRAEFRQKIISKKTDFPKTFAYIEEIKKHLLVVHRNLGQAVVSLKVDIKN